MKIKTKLTLGVGLLFTLIILLSSVATRCIYTLKKDTENILVANYNSLQFGNKILAAMESGSDKAVDIFESNLQNQEKNITEIGEKDATENLRIKFDLYKKNRKDPELQANIRKDIYKIMELNMQAIQRKSKTANTNAISAVSYIVITGTLCFLIAFVLLINLPSNIANPIKELTVSIKQIADKNYTQRVHFESNSEFGELAFSFNTMAAKLEEYNDSNLAILMMEKKRIEALINNMHDPVIGLDEHLKVLFINEEAINIIGMKQEEVIGKASQDLALRNDLMRTLIQDFVLPDSGNSSRSKPIKIFSDQKEGYFEKEIIPISIAPTGEKLKKLIGHVIILRNITEYKELDFAKTNFIATVSHEFKTPIASIKMSLQLLENDQIGVLNSEQTNLVNSIKEDANRLLKITGELLNMTQVESGNIQLAMLPSDPKEILQVAINATQTLAEQKQIRFEIKSTDEVIKVQADSDKTAWVLTNLISNAIRYSYDNTSIYLTITRDKDHVMISVRDTGQGIAPQYLDKIFDRYFRIPGTRKEGTGLGLAISKEFIEAQNGTISVESEYGKGSTFTVSLLALK